MHRRRSDPLRQLRPGRAALRAEPGVRLLFSSPGQRPAVREHWKARGAAGARDGEDLRRGAEPGMSSLEETRVPDDDGLLSSLRYLFADFLDEQDTTPPSLPDGLPESVASIVDDGISVLMDYQGAAYAKLYVERLQRFIGRVDVSPAMLSEIARLLANRMAYQDAIRIAQLKLAQFDQTGVRSVERIRLRFDELVDALPAVAAEPVLEVLRYLGWLHKQVSIPFSTASLWGIRRLKMEA